MVVSALFAVISAVDVKAREFCSCCFESIKEVEHRTFYCIDFSLVFSIFLKHFLAFKIFSINHVLFLIVGIVICSI